jgi:hypothetical protein
MTRHDGEIGNVRDQAAATMPPISTYLCGICGGSWSQVDGTNPQTHKPGCPNAKEGDVERR